MAASLKLASFPIRHHEHLIAEIMPCREVHILAGASGSSKTTLMFQLIDTFVNGGEIFGFPVSPTPVGYLCADRSDDGLQRTFERVGTVAQIPRYSIFTHPDFAGCFEPLASIRLLVTKHPEVKFVIFDAVSTMVENVNSAKEVGNFLKSLTKLAQVLNITILIIHHTAKMKKDSGYTSPRQMMAGCGAWGGFSDLNIIITAEDDADANNPYRDVHICPRNAANQTVRMILGESGLLLPVPHIEEKKSPADRKAAEDAIFTTIPSGRIHTSTLFETLNRPPNSRFYRTIERWVGGGFLTRSEKGWYDKP